VNDGSSDPSTDQRRPMLSFLFKLIGKTYENIDRDPHHLFRLQALATLPLSSISHTTLYKAQHESRLDPDLGKLGILEYSCLMLRVSALHDCHDQINEDLLVGGWSCIGLVLVLEVCCPGLKMLWLCKPCFEPLRSKISRSWLF
jgi:hypothetical protein